MQKKYGQKPVSKPVEITGIVSRNIYAETQKKMQDVVQAEMMNRNYGTKSQRKPAIRPYSSQSLDTGTGIRSSFDYT